MLRRLNTLVASLLVSGAAALSFTAPAQAATASADNASGKYQGWGKGFKFKQILPEFTENWLMSGTLKIKPKNPDANVWQILLSRTRGKRKNKVLSIIISQTQGPNLKYEHRGGINIHDPIVPFIQAACEQINQKLRNEDRFSSELLKDLEF